MRKKMLSMSAESALRKEIKKGGGNENGDIFSQIEFLAETVEKFGEKAQYLPLRIKKLLATMLDPDYRIEYIVEKSQSGDCWCSVEARLYWSDLEKPSGVGFVKRYLSQIAQRDSLTHEERESLMEATCRGLAASRALTEAGIGQHLYGEDDDFEKKEESADVSNALELQMEKELPQPKTFNEKKGGVKNMPETTLPLPEPEPEFIPEEGDLTAPELPEKSEIMSIDEAKSKVADKGTYMGTTLGEIYELNPKNLVWLYHQDSAVKEAAATLVRTIPELAAKLN